MADPAPPPPGWFRMYPRLEPDVPAGSYVLQGDVTLPGPVEQLQAHVEVVSPRYVLPPEQILSTFPPAQGRGAYVTRLPQIVLRRRTLPWERPHAAGDPRPWLALVLLADGEGELRVDKDPGQCVTPGRTAPVPAETTRAAYVEVPEAVLQHVFPTQEEIGLLAHVRQVDLHDTELAMGDDDGWVAVVLCNRLPRPDTSYLAVLVSLEGQVDLLLPDAQVTSEPENDLLVTHVLDLRALAAAELGSQLSADALTLQQAPPAWGRHVTDAAAPLLRGPQAVRADVTAVRADVSAARQPDLHVAEAGWAATGAASVLSSAGTRVRSEMVQEFAFPATLALQQTYRFPALAYWRFTCEGDEDFESLARRLDIGLLGQVRAADQATAPPPGAPPDAAAELPGDPRTVLAVETGHIATEHITRRGEHVTAWFRGPLVPSPVTRVQADEQGHLPIAHHADQVRIVTPDGREDLSYAAGFEIGRLLALSQPSVVAALGRWRGEAYGAARTRLVGRPLLEGLAADRADRLLAADPIAPDTATAQARALGARLAAGLVDALGVDPAAVAPARPAADPGAPAGILAALLRGGDKALLAGLGLVASADHLDDPQRLTDSLVAAAPAVAAVPEPGSAEAVAALRGALETEVGGLLSGTGRFVRGGDVGGLRAGPGQADGDELDAILDRASEGSRP